MAKAAKPAHVLQHAGPTAKLSPNHPSPENSNVSGKRKRMAKAGGKSTDKRAASFGKSSTENMTENRWKLVVSAIGNGATRKEAAKAAKISTQTIDAYLISNIAAYKQIRDAILL